jgi:protein-S-isoprenylcysteine O-methyltransferase Ste14
MILFLKNLLFTVVAPGTVAVCVPLVIARGRSAVSGPMIGLALVLLAVGAAIYTWCVVDFAVFGRGTPAPIDAPKHLVVRGLYRYTRNPMYLGVSTTILGWAVLYQSAALAGYLIVVGFCFHLFIVLYEERHLEAVFPDQYEEYRNRVGRWLPVVRRRHSR